MKVKLTVLAVFVIAILAGLTVGFTSGKSEPASAANGDRCPAGSYEIGSKEDDQPICKLEPTGCPWGDSVPMDKCAPPADIECNADWTVCKPKAIGTAEKQQAIAEHDAAFKDQQATGCYK